MLFVEEQHLSTFSFFLFSFSGIFYQLSLHPIMVLFFHVYGGRTTCLMTKPPG